jgi:cytochrome c biogenesis protein CcmG, thiol:disulfide interchange protein DsbE
VSIRALIPFALFALLAFFLGRGLWQDPREIPSPLLNRPLPHFTLLPLEADKPLDPINPAQRFEGQVWILNVWASWCVACRKEHPALLAFAAKKTVPLVGLNYKDDPLAARQWLLHTGNPYVFSLVDSQGQVGIDLGVYGTPETFFIDKNGTVRARHVGVITLETLERYLAPLLTESMPLPRTES